MLKCKNADGTWSVVSAVGEKPISKTYSELNTLATGSQLVVGQSYRITDYTATTGQSNTQSAGFNFDIIVTAITSSTFSENVRFVHNASDSHFTNSNVEAWEGRYIFGDASKYSWYTGGSAYRGLITYLKDEFDNKCYYDFKNIQFLNSSTSAYNYTFGGTEDFSLTNANQVYNNTILPYEARAYKKTLNANIFLNANTHDNTICGNCYNNLFKSSVVHARVSSYNYDNTYEGALKNCIVDAFNDFTVTDKEAHSSSTVCYIRQVGTSLVSSNVATANQNFYDAIYPLEIVVFQTQAPGVPDGVIATWEDVTTDYDGRSLWLSSSNAAGTALAGSLPEITGYVNPSLIWKANNSTTITGTGAFSASSGSMAGTWTDESGDNHKYGYESLSFKASGSNSIYGAAAGTNVVRPTSVTIKAFKRTV